MKFIKVSLRRMQQLDVLLCADPGTQAQLNGCGNDVFGLRDLLIQVGCA
jgi:hypothetical protein